jgi:hypothetical protein
MPGSDPYESSSSDVDPGTIDRGRYERIAVRINRHVDLHQGIHRHVIDAIQPRINRLSRDLDQEQQRTDGRQRRGSCVRRYPPRDCPPPVQLELGVLNW